jgi:TPR repeat protein
MFLLLILSVAFLSAKQTSSEEDPELVAATDAVDNEDAAKCYEAVDAKIWQDAQIFCSAAAEKGDAGSATNLGYLYENGLGVETNQTEAVAWYKKAAIRGDAVGQFNLGLSYQYGTGVKADLGEAIRWLQTAADQGYEDAKKRLTELQAKKTKESQIGSWLGRYQGTLFGEASATMRVTQTDEKLNFDLFMEGEYCGGGFEQTATPKNSESIVVTMPYDADSGLQCKVQINQKSFGLELKELSSCQMHHGFRCGFEGRLFKQ